MPGQFQSVQGFNDVLYPDVTKFNRIENTVRELFALYNFKEIRTPIIEKTGLFVRSIGGSTDIVEKEMYTFQDKGEESLTLRPEGTASAVRAYLEHDIDKKDAVQKWFYIGPMFRHERPQKGRFRQFYQAGIEVFGIDDPVIDVEVIELAKDVIDALYIKGVVIRLNSIGCPACRPDYIRELKLFLYGVKDQLCDDCKRRIETNPLRVLDCKKNGCISTTKNAPKITEHLCADCASHFDSVKRGLDLLKIQYTIDTRLVRGLDYYTKTVFEFTVDTNNAQNAVIAGGRYDYLVELLGGGHVPAIGFAMGMERIADMLKLPDERNPDVFIAVLVPRARSKAFELMGMLRQNGIMCDTTYGEKTIKSMMRRAGKLKARVVMIIGEDELEHGYVTLKRMADAHQDKVQDSEVLNHILKNSI